MPGKEWKTMRESPEWLKSKHKADQDRWKKREKKLKGQVASLTPLKSKLKQRTIILSSLFIIILSISLVSFFFVSRPKRVDLWFEVNAFDGNNKIILNLESVTDEQIVLSYHEDFTYLLVVVETTDDSLITILTSTMKTSDGSVIGTIVTMDYDDVIIFLHQGVEITFLKITIHRMIPESE